MMETARYISSLPVDGVKVHSLYVLAGTGLAEMYRELNLLTKDEYIGITCDFLQHLREDIIVQRLTGDPPVENFLGPGWCREKRDVLAGIHAEFASRKTCQGSEYESIAQTLST